MLPKKVIKKGTKNNGISIKNKIKKMLINFEKFNLKLDKFNKLSNS